jgi:hypothetical protein
MSLTMSRGAQPRRPHLADRDEHHPDHGRDDRRDRAEGQRREDDAERLHAQHDPRMEAIAPISAATTRTVRDP